MGFVIEGSCDERWHNKVFLGTCFSKHGFFPLKLFPRKVWVNWRYSMYSMQYASYSRSKWGKYVLQRRAIAKCPWEDFILLLRANSALLPKRTLEVGNLNYPSSKGKKSLAGRLVEPYVAKLRNPRLLITVSCDKRDFRPKRKLDKVRSNSWLRNWDWTTGRKTCVGAFAKWVREKPPFKINSGDMKGDKLKFGNFFLYQAKGAD